MHLLGAFMQKATMTKGLKRMRYLFNEMGLTHYGGMLLINSFCKKLGLKRLLQTYVKFPKRSGTYHPSELILALIYLIIAGIPRIHKSKSLQYNGSLPNLIGIKKFPDPATLRRFLHSVTPKEIRQIVHVHDLLRQKLFCLPRRQWSVVFDIDPTALTVYGKQKRARVGYNPKKRGRRCYSMFLCFEDHHQEFWHGSLMPGNVSAVIVGKHFLARCLAKIPEWVYRIRVRGDSSFYSHKFIQPLDEQGIGYTFEVQVRGPMIDKIQSLPYRSFKGDWEVGEFYYQPTKWKQVHRFVVVRRPLPEDPEETRQLSLFVMKNYGYRVLITNLALKPENVWYWHCQRAHAELNIKELKGSFSLTKIPTKSYLANVAYFQLLLFAYDIVSWFKRLCLSSEFRYATLQTIRENLLVLPGRFTHSGHKNILKLPKGFIYQRVFDYAVKRIEGLTIK
jgi:hypothetical protein